jgi:plastocyanin
MIRRLVCVSAICIVVGAAPVAAATHTVTVVDFAFKGGQVSVALGDTVRWDNTGGFTHSTTGDPPLALWSIDIPAGGAKTRTFRQAGTFGYYCRFHSQMVGAVKVPMRVSDSTPRAGQEVTLTVATVGAPAGYCYSIQRQAPGGSFKTWKAITGRTTHFKSKNTGTWHFRSRLLRTADGATSGWSPLLRIRIHA